jgi:general L-amino acid transport system substrate-binding protein
MRRFRLALLFGSLFASLAPASADTLDDIRQRGELVCGVSQGVLGFSALQANGQWTGLDVDFCRALSAAIFDDPAKVRFVPLSAEQRFEALRSKQIDVLSRNSTWTMGRETGLGLAFAAVTYYDGQAFMVRRMRNIGSALELKGMKVCVQAGTTTELNLRDYFRANNMALEAVAVSNAEAALAAYQEERCDALTTDASQLHGERLKTTSPTDHDILPEIISKEPLGPAVRQDDFRWFNIVKWTHFAMLEAEEQSVTSQTIEAALTDKQPAIMRLVGTDGNFGEQLGLTKDWAARIVRHVGNYGEVYDRNVGLKSRLGIARGINQLWSSGGILYGPPIR